MGLRPVCSFGRVAASPSGGHGRGTCSSLSNRLPSPPGPGDNRGRSASTPHSHGCECGFGLRRPFGEGEQSGAAQLGTPHPGPLHLLASTATETPGFPVTGEQKLASWESRQAGPWVAVLMVWRRQGRVAQEPAQVHGGFLTVT